MIYIRLYCFPNNMDICLLAQLRQWPNFVTEQTNLKSIHMRRFAFKMYLKPGFEKEYEKRHAELWPELRKQISDSGVRNYSIFWDKDTNILFGYQEVEGDSNSQDAEAADEITRKWWDYMADIMDVNPDNSPVTIPLKEVFHLD